MDPRTLDALGAAAKSAKFALAKASTAQKNEALGFAAESLATHLDSILAANAADVGRSEAEGVSATVVDRLRLDERRVGLMADGLLAVAGLPDPVGEVLEGWVRPNGLRIRRVRVPLGVVGIVYENRPNVTSDAAALCLKSGNAALLRGSAGAIDSNIAIAAALRSGIAKAALPEDAVVLVDDIRRETVTEFVRLRGTIDLLVPRGGQGLIVLVLEHATVPFIIDGDGNCHVFVDATADLDMAERIIVNAKTQRPSVCNAMETLLVHESVADTFLLRIARTLSGVEIVGDDRTRARLPGIAAATDEDFATEFLDLKMSVAVVDDLDGAISHIARYSSGHSEAIVTRDLASATRFTNEVDAAAVLVNASTRFVDGGELGFGAEIGISTQKLHARGPMGLRELTSVKYVIEGDGQVRGVSDPVVHFDGPEGIERGLGTVGYLADSEIATAVYLADRLGKPILVEGPAGTGKTELASRLQRFSNVRLIRLQCYEGLDEAKVLYEWNYRKQLLRIQVARSGGGPDDGPGWSEIEEDIFSAEFLLERPLLEAIRAVDPVVLLIDEIDRVEVETEALLLEVLSEYQVSIPELGTVTATQIPLVFLTSNGTRELSEALKRRCLYLYLDYPTLEREREIVLARVPGIASQLADEIVRIVRLLRTLDLQKHPSISETLDWARTLVLLGVEHADAATTSGTLNLLLKFKSDIDLAQRELEAAAPVGVAVLDVLDGFIAELRAAGIAVSVRESIDAAEAVDAVGLSRRDALESALSATLIKVPEHRAIFKAAFEVYFSLRLGSPHHRLFAGDEDNPAPDEGAPESATSGRYSGDDAPLAPDDVRQMAREALRSGDLIALTSVARLAVELFGGVDPSRPVGVSYYLHRTLRGLEIDALVAAILAEPPADSIAPELGSLGDRLRAEEATERSEHLRELIEAEIRRRLVEARGAAQVARTLRRPLIDDIDFISATREELAQMRRTIRPLAAHLATRLVRRRRRGRRGPLDFRKTIRRSLSTGGVPLDPRFRSPHPAQPELVVLADISGSVASFARFTVHLVSAISSQFSKVRTTVFIDGIDDVSELLRRTPSIADAVEAIAVNAAVVQGDGHSDYGAAFVEFHHRFARTVGGRTNVIVLGDARNNYHRPEAWVLEDLRRRVHKVYWLNPEPRAYWGSGDSIMEQYAVHCDGVFECRNLRQLRAFVDELA